MAPVVRANEDAGHLDLLGGSCLLLTRIVMGVSTPERHRLAPSVRALGDALAGLAQRPDDHETRQSAVDHALAAIRRLAGAAAPAGSPLAEAIMTVRLVTTDILVFAGVEPGQALSAESGG